MTTTLEPEAPGFTVPPDTPGLIWRNGRPTLGEATEADLQAAGAYLTAPLKYQSWEELKPDIDAARTPGELLELLEHGSRIPYLNQWGPWKEYLYAHAKQVGVTLPSRVRKSFERK